MRLKQLAIRRKEAYEDKNRPLTGTVLFEGADGAEIKINVSESTSNRIVELCAEGVVDAATELSQLMVRDVLDSLHPALEHKE
jgi:hypothetical protein